MDDVTIGRRRFYVTAIYGLGALMSAAMAIPAAVYLLFPPRARKKGELVEVADISKLPVGAPEEVVFRRTRVDGWKVTSEKATAWVVKTAEGQAIAFAPQCTHLGCAFSWDDRKRTFVCPCHTSAFSLDGRVLEGPAPRPLDRYETEVRGSKLLIGNQVIKSA